MKIETEKKTIDIVLRTRKIAELSIKLGGKNFEILYGKAFSESDITALGEIIKAFAENAEGRQAFSKLDDVYDFIDDYKKESDKTYTDIFTELAEVINDEGFFTKKLNKKEMSEMASNPLAGMDMNDLVKKTAEKAIGKMAEKEFEGFKA